MGYRSHVGIALSFKTKAVCDKFILAYKLKEPEFWLENVTEYWDRADERVLVGYYDNVKWLRGYDDVDAVHNMLEWAVEHCDAAYRFVRVGEEYEDIEITEEDDNADENTPMLCDYVDVRREVDIAGGNPLD